MSIPGMLSLENPNSRKLGKSEQHNRKIRNAGKTWENIGKKHRAAGWKVARGAQAGFLMCFFSDSHALPMFILFSATCDLTRVSRGD